MTNNYIIETQHIPQWIEWKIVLEDGTEVFNNISEETIKSINDTKKLVEGVLTITPSYRLHPTTWVTTDDKNNIITSKVSIPIAKILASDEQWLQKIKENTRITRNW